MSDDADGDGGTDGPTGGPAGPLGLLVSVFVNRTEGRLRAPWRLLLGVVGIGVAVFLVGVAASGLLGGALPGLLGQALVMLAVLVAVPLVGYAVDRRHLGDFGLRFDAHWWRDAAFGVALGALMPTVVFLVLLAAGWVTVTDVLTTTGDAFLSFGVGSPGVTLLSVAVFFLGVSAYEELFTRGYLLTNVAEGLTGVWRFDYRAGLAVALLSTSGLFGGLHAANPSASVLSTVNITLFGVLLGLGFVWTDRLGVPVGVHLGWNTVLGAGYGFPVSGITVGVAVLETETAGPALATGGSFGPEGGIVALVALVVGLTLQAWWVRRAYGDLALRESVAVPSLRD